MPLLNFTGVGTYNAVYYNVSTIMANQPPLMTTQTVWIIFALTGIVLLLLSASTNSEMCNDLSGVLSSLFLLVSALQAFAVDVITGSAFTSGTDAPYLGVMLQTHTIYHYDLWGVVFGIIFVISLANLYRLWLDSRKIVDQPRMQLQQDDTQTGGNSRGQPDKEGRGGKSGMQE